MDSNEVPTAVALDADKLSSSGYRNTADIDLAEKQPVPVTIITGYLGSGKTTLVNNIITEEHGFRVAVILNDYGETTGIEKAVLQNEANAAFSLQDIVELGNGCLCCSSKNDFVQALEGLLQQRSRFDYLLVETSGLADPGPVAAALWTDTELQSTVCLDAIVTVIDARNIGQQLAQKPSKGAINEAQQQIAYADIVLLNKVDLVPDSAARKAITATVSQLNATAEVHETTRCHIHLEHILGRGILQSSGPTTGLEEGRPSQDLDVLFKTGSVGAREALASRGFAEGTASQHTHDSGVGSVTLHAGSVHLERLRRWLDELLWEENAAKRDIFRMKGGVSVIGSDAQHVLQAVQDLYEVIPGPAWAEEADRTTKIVVVGRGLDYKALQSGLDNCKA